MKNFWSTPCFSLSKARRTGDSQCYAKANSQQQNCNIKVCSLLGSSGGSCVTDGWLINDVTP